MPRSNLESALRSFGITSVQKVAGLCHTLTEAIDRWMATLERTRGWRRVNPRDESYDFLDVFLIDQDVGFAVGREGIVFKTTDGGIAWNQLAHNMTTEDLYGVHFADRNIGYVVGEAGTILRTEDGGESWDFRYSLGLTYHHFRDVFVFNSQKTIVVGGRYTPTPVDDGAYWYLPGHIFLTNDGGLTWSTPRRIPAEVPWLSAIDMASSTTGTVVGGAEARGGHFRSSIILRTEDGGQRWHSQENPFKNEYRPNLDFDINDVDFHDENLGIAVSWATPPIYTSDGETWQDSHRCGCIVIYQYGVSFADANTAIHVGRGLDSAGVMKSNNAGQEWNIVDYGKHIDLQAVSFANSSRGVAVGEYSSVIRTDDGGETWQSSNQFQPGIVRPEEELLALSFVDSNVGYAVGWFGTILRTANGGAEWERVGNRWFGSLQALYFHSAENGFLVGGSLHRTTDGFTTIERFRTTDGGQTFSVQSEGNSYGNFEAIDFCDPQTGVLVGVGIIYMTTNSGVTWKRVSPHIDIHDLWLNDVKFVNSETVIAVGTRMLPSGGRGEGTILRSTDACVTWQRLDLPSGGAPGELRAGRLNAVYFPQGQNQVGYAVGNNGAVLKTNDGGNAWRRLELRIGSEHIQGHWNGVCFTDPEKGWIVGGRERVRERRRPWRRKRYGAILHTPDGGQTWREQSTSFATPETLETLEGKELNDVYFVNEKVGTAVGEGGLIISTATGGV